MSIYTTEVRYICEREAGLKKSTGYNDIDDVIDKSWNKIFKKFPIFDEQYREPLCKKILNHYYTREICAETVALWKFWLNQKMAEIMPYYNKLYLSEQLKFDPLHEIDFTRIVNEKSNADKTGNGKTNVSQNSAASSNENSNRAFNGTNEKKSTTIETVTTDANKKGKDLHSDTPQGGIQNITENGYLTDAHITDENNNSTVSSDISNNENNSAKNTDTNNVIRTNTETTKENNVNEYNENNVTFKEYTEHISGKNSSASYSRLISEYRETLLNIDIDVIFELRELFMNIY